MENEKKQIMQTNDTEKNEKEKQQKIIDELKIKIQQETAQTKEWTEKAIHCNNVAI